MARKAADRSLSLEIPRIKVEEITIPIIGQSPFLHNRMPAKAMREFLFPMGRRRTNAERVQGLKHDPMQEFLDSAHVMRPSATKPAVTLLGIPAPAFKGSMGTAALDLPGSSRAEIGRLLWVEGYTIPMWGIPTLKMDIVRSADIKKTPDVRTRACVELWCAEIPIKYVVPNLNGQSVMNLLVGGGLTCGVGDGRQEKGKLSYGQFAVLDQTDKEQVALFNRIKREGGRKQQEAAMKNPACFDDETAELLAWFNAELKRRGHANATPPAKRKAA